MKLLTVLGTGKYNETCYTWQNQEVKTCYVAKAICEFFHPDDVTVLVTTESKAMHWEKFKSELGETIQVTDALIPLGESEDDIWKIFDVVVNAIEPNSQVIFDITHAFRSIPLFVLLAAAFLQKARNVDIQGVYYGAFEVNREKPPIFDLTPAVKLLDWLTATDKFVNTGSSVELGQLLSNIQRDFYRTGRQKTADIKPTRLLSFGDRIQGISRSLELVRPIDLIKETAKLQNLPLSQLENEIGAFAKPFELLFSQIQQDYGQFALLELDKSSASEQLQKQFLLLRWYVAKNLGTQAILLGREWLISALCLAEGITDYRNQDEREVISKQLGQMIGSHPNLDQPISRHVSSAQQLAAFWSKLTEYRNDVAHVQMRHTEFSADKLQRFIIQELIQSLSSLFPQFVI